MIGHIQLSIFFKFKWSPTHQMEKTSKIQGINLKKYTWPERSKIQTYAELLNCASIL